MRAHTDALLSQILMDINLKACLRTPFVTALYNSACDIVFDSV